MDRDKSTDIDIDYKELCKFALDMVKDMKESLWAINEILLGLYSELNDENSKLFKQSKNEKR